MRMSAARLRSIVPARADAKVRNACLPTWMATYEQAKSSPFDPNASGMATAITQGREHDRHQQQAHDRRVGIELVRHPGRVVPRPPDHEQHERRLARALPAQVLEQKMRHLRDGEDEDEVVEELQRRRPLLLPSVEVALEAARLGCGAQRGRSGQG